MQTLASVVEADLISKGVLGVPNLVSMNTAGTTPSNALALARAKMNQYLTPAGDRSALITSTANVALSGEISRLHNPTQASSKAYLDGYVATAFGSDLFEHQSIPTHTKGTAATITVSAASQTGSSITMTAGTGGTLVKGDVISQMNEARGQGVPYANASSNTQSLSGAQSKGFQSLIEKHTK